MKSRLVFLPLVAGLAWPLTGWGQAAGESAATPEPETPPTVAQASEPPVQRSALWQSIYAHQHQDEAQVLAQDRRLTPEQLLQLREQVRETWKALDADQATASAAARAGVQP